MSKMNLRTLALQQFVEIVPVTGRFDVDLAGFGEAASGC